jgi:hypothetical protein
VRKKPYGEYLFEDVKVLEPTHCPRMEALVNGDGVGDRVSVSGHSNHIKRGAQIGVHVVGKAVALMARRAGRPMSAVGLGLHLDLFVVLVVVLVVTLFVVVIRRGDCGGMVVANDSVWIDAELPEGALQLVVLITELPARSIAFIA